MDTAPSRGDGGSATLSVTDGYHPNRVFTYVAQRTLYMKRAGGLLDKRVKGQRYPITAAGFKTAWRRATAKAGIRKFRNHDLRHAFGTALYDETGDIYAVQDAMGHADVKTTMRYVHKRPEAINTAITAISKNRLRKAHKTSGLILSVCPGRN
ncbi:tyrosine-type recombinase/integrase [Bradyrhizobium sp.]|uniref:tyrosine-type recombinase/integrase n=1 Tax=Bradyrhizobium sp. TaxID=376 RepID=UPI003BAF087F